MAKDGLFTDIAMELIEIKNKFIANEDELKSVAKRGLELWIEQGKLLLDAKKQLDHGKYIPWLNKELFFNKDQASKYTRIAEYVLDGNAYSNTLLNQATSINEV